MGETEPGISCFTRPSGNPKLQYSSEKCPQEIMNDGNGYQGGDRYQEVVSKFSISEIHVYSFLKTPAS